jgi:hypothetical protein
MDTIILPECGEQRWINLVPLPPKAKREPQQDRNNSREKEKSSGDVLNPK